MIIDEAGQVAPDLAGATFALAKKALVVGDTKQLQPVWTITPAVDTGNLQRNGVAVSAESCRAFEQMGITASSGSVMTIAQRASYYEVFAGERGMFLSEHRRCVPEIISYCNELAYHGRLNMERPSIEQRMLPAMGYAHIAGTSCQYYGSRENRAEAEAIAQWIADKRKSLEEHYPTIALDKIIGVVTPFARHTVLIQEALRRRKIGNITVGTVHTLQGAERQIILFSPVYHERESFFFDQGVNMLNVAVSRAKDSFLVFGNMNIFEPYPQHATDHNHPSSLLARYLFANEANELTDIQIPLRDFNGIQVPIQHIRTLDDHRRTLAECIASARQDVRIVSPFLSPHPINADNLLPLVRQAIDRGVTVTLYTDDQLNRDDTGHPKENARRAMDMLRGCGALIKVVNRVHSKTICVDSTTLIEGSFNWLSASRDEHFAYQRHEASIRYDGPGVSDMIANTLKDLDARVLH